MHKNNFMKEYRGGRYSKLGTEGLKHLEETIARSDKVGVRLKYQDLIDGWRYARDKTRSCELGELIPTINSEGEEV